ncbi:MAG TPA: ATP-binding protein [bacterium]|nr:ATP-binding protein [bacterium]
MIIKNLEDLNNISYNSTSEILSFIEQENKCKLCLENNKILCSNGYKFQIIIDDFNNYKIYYYKCNKFFTNENKILINKIYEQSNLTDKEKEKTFNNFIVNNNNKEIYNKIKSFAESNKIYNFILAGKSGIGKTHLALAFLNYKINNFLFNSLFYNFSDLFNILKYSFNSNSFYETLNFIKNIKLLIIDDLGDIKITEFIFEYFFNIIDFRYRKNEQLITIITTNFNKPSELINYFGDSGIKIMSRLCEMSFWFSWVDNDFRLNDFKANEKK